MTGTFYLAPGFFGTPGFLTSAQLPVLTSAGMEIAAHTMTHPDLVSLLRATRLAELQDSKSQLELLTGQPVTALAVPIR